MNLTRIILIILFSLNFGLLQLSAADCHTWNGIGCCIPGNEDSICKIKGSAEIGKCKEATASSTKSAPRWACVQDKNMTSVEKTAKRKKLKKLVERINWEKKCKWVNGSEPMLIYSPTKCSKAVINEPTCFGHVSCYNYSKIKKVKAATCSKDNCSSPEKCLKQTLKEEGYRSEPYADSHTNSRNVRRHRNHSEGIEP